MTSSGGSGDRGDRYWRANLKLLGVLLAIWFTVSFGFGILLRDTLDAIRIPGTGFNLGFWFAQQGSILVFVVLIFVYARLMNRLDDSMGDGGSAGTDEDRSEPPA